MRPFDPPPTLPKADPTPAVLATPLGNLSFRADVGGASPEPFEGFGEALPYLRRFRLEGMRADLLIFAIEPSLPAGMVTHGCFGAVWRLEATRDLPGVILTAVWEPGGQAEGGAIESGEHLMALTWDAPGVRLSLGTSDEEMLDAMAHRGEFLPHRLAGAFQREERFAPRTAGEREGLAVELPPLQTGDAAQIHFVVAWRTGAFDDRDVSTWYAVDLPPGRIAALADAALGSLPHSQGKAGS